MGDLLRVEQFHGAVDSNTPLFNRDPGWLKTMQNFRSRPGGFMEARGGYEAARPSGGTTAALDSSGIVAGIHEHFQNHGCIIGNVGGGASFTTDLGQIPSFNLFGTVNSVAIFPPELSTNTADNAWYFGSTFKFSRLRINLTQGTGGGGYTVAWEYHTTGGAWSALTGPTEDFSTGGVKDIEWRLESNWNPRSVNNIYLYWVRVRIVVPAVAAQTSFCINSPVLGDWRGRRMLFGAATTSSSGTANGKLRYYTQDTSNVVVWADAFVGATTLFSGNDPRYRFATFQDRLIYVNGKENQRYNNDRASDLGLSAPTALTITVAAGAVGPPSTQFGQPCVFDYGIAFGYGANSKWGTSNVFKSTTGPSTFTATDQAQLAWTTGGVTPGQTAQVHIYRTDDLTGVPVSDRSNQPMHRIAVIDYNRDGGATMGANLAYTDYTYGFPFPAFPAELEDKTPPARCRFVKVIGERVVLGSNEQFPSRFWWSEIGEGENFVNQEENFADLAYSGGGPLTGLEVAFDTIYGWNENLMVGATSLDEDIPNIFEVPGGKGSVAPDAVCTGYSVLMWASDDGIYLMTRDGEIRNVSGDQRTVFGKMNYETHGGSRATMHNSMYEIQLMNPAGTPVSGQSRWRFDLLKYFQRGDAKESWSTSTVTFAPFAFVTAPLGHADQGVKHPIYANATPSVADRNVYVGEYTTADAGSGYACIADMHLGPPKFQKFGGRWRFAAYYQSDSGWGTPTISAPPGATYIFKTIAGFGAVTPKSGTDYKLALANSTEAMSGAQDIVVRFSVTSAAGGTVNNQRLIAAYLEGKIIKVHPTA